MARVFHGTPSGATFEQARADDGLAHLHEALGDHGRARRYGQHALDAFTALGVPEAARVRERLATRERSGRR